MIFLDTSFLVSLFVEKEENNKKATKIAINIKDEEKIISKLIIAETITILKKR